MFQIIGNWAFNSKFFNNRISFLCGPRQIGKTTLSKKFLKSVSQENNYFNWDTFTVKEKFEKNPLFFIEELPPLNSIHLKQYIVFDELHKHPKWKEI